MHEQTQVIVKYDEHDHLFILRLSGKMDAHTLDAGAVSLRNTLESNLEKGEALKLLIDFREALWDSEQTHVGARQLLGTPLRAFQTFRHFAAILINQRAFQPSANEAFFTEEREALNWLRSQH